MRDRGERLLAAAHIPARYQHCELSNFQCDPDDKGQKSIRDARFLAGRFVEEYPTDKTGLLFVGIGRRRQNAPGGRHHEGL